MRIGLVSMQASPGTADAELVDQHRQVAEVAAVLARGGHDVRIYTRQTVPDAPLTVATAGGVTVEYGPAGPPTPLDTDELAPHVDEFGGWLGERWREGSWQPHVVHAHFWLSGLAATAAGRATGLPVVQTYHSLGSVRRRWYGRVEPATRTRVKMERELGRTVDRIVAQSQAEAVELTRLGVRRDAITVVPSGVDTAVFTPKGEAAPADSGRPRILAVGRPSPPNGFDELISALRWVPAAELVIAGGPAPERLDGDPQAHRLRRLADEMGVADRVRLLGAVPAERMPSWYRSADVYACTSWYESFGLPAVEAMACGAPVVAYAVGGLVESVVHRVTGLLVQPHDVRGFGITLRRLLQSEIERLAFADAGVDRVQCRYDWQRVVADLERVYDSVRRSRGRTS